MSRAMGMADRSSVRRVIAALLMSAGCGGESTSLDNDSSTGHDSNASESTTAALPSGATDSTSSGGLASADTSAESSSHGDPSSTGHGTSEATDGAPIIDPRGYTLVAPMGSRHTYLIDADGREINRWESETVPANAAYMLPAGRMLRVSRDPEPAVELVSGVGGIIQEYDWDGDVVWHYEHTGPGIAAHHDVEWLPNGHVLVVAYEMFSWEEAVAAGRDPADVAPEGLWADFLVEIDPATDEIVWEWHVWDHLIQDHDPMASNYGEVGAHPERIDIGWTRPTGPPRPDWTHVNAVAYNAQLDQIILSPRTFSELWVIDHSTTTEQAAGRTGGSSGRGGDLLYRWGNPAAYRAGDELDRELYFQHDPHWIEPGKPGGGRILVFDNGDPVLRPWSRVLEIDTPVRPDGTYAAPEPYFEPFDPSWIYEEPESFFASFISGADRLADGRTLVSDGPSGRLFEIDARGQVGWSFSLGASFFRAERYEADHPAWHGLSAEDLVPGRPVVIETEPE